LSFDICHFLFIQVRRVDNESERAFPGDSEVVRTLRLGYRLRRATLWQVRSVGEGAPVVFHARNRTIDGPYGRPVETSVGLHILGRRNF